MDSSYLYNHDKNFNHVDRLFSFDRKLPNHRAQSGPEDPSGKYVINSMGYRSDEFYRDDSGTGVVFAGCSQTFGTAIYDDELIWPKILFNRIRKDTGTERFINLGTPGASFYGIISTVLRYIESYGKPRVVFALFPDLFRGFRMHKDLDGYYDIYVDPEKYSYHRSTGKEEDISKIIKSAIPYMYEQYYMFEKLLESYGVHLISTSYNSPIMLDIFKSFNFKTFHDFNKIPSGLTIDEFLYSNDDGSSTYLYAEDGAHYGTGYHAYIAEMMYNVFYEEHFGQAKV